MTGTITKRLRRDGKPTWGYSFFAGRQAGDMSEYLNKAGPAGTEAREPRNA